MLILFLLLFFGCSPERRHQVMKVIFEGVPDKDSTKNNMTITAYSTGASDSTKSEGVSKMMQASQGVTHPPYLSRDCKVCHDDGMRSRTRIRQPDLCYECHTDFKEKFKWVHGPVAGGYCTSCHSPHFSKNAKLVLRQGQQLCLHCHDKESVFKNDTHKDIGETVCMDCHHPHGGEDKLILR